MSAGTTVFPTTIDSNAVKTNTDEITSTDQNDRAVQIEALETKVGVNSSAVATSIDYLLKSTSSSNPGHKHTVANGATDIVGAWTTFVSTITGFASPPTQNIEYQKIGRTVIMLIDFYGTSNSAGITITLPFTSSKTSFYGGYMINNAGSTSNVPGRLDTALGSNIAILYPNHFGDGWSPSATQKGLFGILIYQSES